MVNGAIFVAKLVNLITISYHISSNPAVVVINGYVLVIVFVDSLVNRPTSIDLLDGDTFFRDHSISSCIVDGVS